MDLGLKQELLRHYLAKDTVYPLLALAAIFPQHRPLPALALPHAHGAAGVLGSLC